MSSTSELEDLSEWFEGQWTLAKATFGEQYPDKKDWVRMEVHLLFSD
tara:strand:+ start:1271 stop:1411 length:141 start_codon:yes stop_codon:yes gene_type:complete